MIASLLAFALAADGVPLNGIQLDDFARNAPACHATPEAQPAIDLDRACVDGACVGMGRAELEAILGPATCGDPVGGTWFCNFDETGIRVGFDEHDPDVASVMFVKEHPGRTADGLGLGSSVRCFLDRFGDETVNVKVDYEDGWLLWRSIHFRDPRLIVTLDREGRATQLQLNRRGIHRFR